MSQKRQHGIFDRLGDLASAITTLTHDYPAGHVVPLHFHDRDQLAYASRGVITVGTRNGTWVVPPHRGVWIPAEIPLRPQKIVSLFPSHAEFSRPCASASVASSWTLGMMTLSQLEFAGNSNKPNSENERWPDRELRMSSLCTGSTREFRARRIVWGSRWVVKCGNRWP